MPALAQHFQVVAIDQRGFNLSDQPEGVENYTLDKLVGEIYRSIGCEVDLFAVEPGRENAVGVLKGQGGGRSRGVFEGMGVPRDVDEWGARRVRSFPAIPRALCSRAHR